MPCGSTSRTCEANALYSALQNLPSLNVSLLRLTLQVAIKGRQRQFPLNPTPAETGPADTKLLRRCTASMGHFLRYQSKITLEPTATAGTTKDANQLSDPAHGMHAQRTSSHSVFRPTPTRLRFTEANTGGKWRMSRYDLTRMDDEHAELSRCGNLVRLGCRSATQEDAK